MMHSYFVRAAYPKCWEQYRINRRRSVLLIPPIGLISALEQSYFVMYPLSLKNKWKLINYLSTIYQMNKSCVHVSFNEEHVDCTNKKKFKNWKNVRDVTCTCIKRLKFTITFGFLKLPLKYTLASNSSITHLLHKKYEHTGIRHNTLVYLKSESKDEKKMLSWSRCACPTYPSSTLADPKTNSPPDLPRAHRHSWANRYANTIRSLA